MKVSFLCLPSDPMSASPSLARSRGCQRRRCVCPVDKTKEKGKQLPDALPFCRRNPVRLILLLALSQRRTRVVWFSNRKKKTIFFGAELITSQGDSCACLVPKSGAILGGESLMKVPAVRFRSWLASFPRKSYNSLNDPRGAGLCHIVLKYKGTSGTAPLEREQKRG
jgi:hypothetical protein